MEPTRSATYNASSTVCVGVKQLKIAVRLTTRRSLLDFGEHVFCEPVALDEALRPADDTADDDENSAHRARALSPSIAP